MLPSRPAPPSRSARYRTGIGVSSLIGPVPAGPGPIGSSLPRYFRLRTHPWRGIHRGPATCEYRPMPSRPTSVLTVSATLRPGIGRRPAALACKGCPWTPISSPGTILGPNEYRPGCFRPTLTWRLSFPPATSAGERVHSGGPGAPHGWRPARTGRERRAAGQDQRRVAPLRTRGRATPPVLKPSRMEPGHLPGQGSYAWLARQSSMRNLPIESTR